MTISVDWPLFKKSVLSGKTVFILSLRRQARGAALRLSLLCAVFNLAVGLLSAARSKRHTTLLCVVRIIPSIFVVVSSYLPIPSHTLVIVQNKQKNKKIEEK